MRTLAAFILGLFLTSPAWADSTIDLLTAGAALTGTEKLPMFQTANPAVTTTPNALKTFVTATGVVTSISNSDGTLTISPTTGAAVGSLALGHANSWTALQTFTTLTASSTVTLTGISTAAGTTCLALNASNQIVGSGSACGTGAGAVTSVTNSDGTLTITPTTGAVVASLALGHANTWSGIQTFSAANGIVYSGAATGTQVACLGLDASNNVIKSAAACGSGGGGTPGGSSGNIQYNNAGAFGGFGFTDGSANTAIANTSATTTAQSLTVYNTWSGGTLPTPTNYERATIDWTTNAGQLTIGTQKGGTGSARGIAFVGGTSGVPTAANYIFFDRDTGAAWDLAINATFLTVNSGSFIGWSSSASGGAPNISQDTSLGRVAAGLIEANNGTAAGVAFVRLNGVVVASLPACSATYQGARGTVTNASQTFTAGIGAIVAGGGANIVPVFCDGTNWRIG
jgi:hypothetical protein